VLAALDRVAASHDVQPASVALAWLSAQPTVVAPIASARIPAHVAAMAASLSLELTADELGQLSAASQPLEPRP